MSGPPPHVSVVMPVYNGSRFVRRAIESVRRQSFPDWELLTVDDASTDDSAELLAELAASDSRIHVLSHATNRGQAAARNTALAQTRGHLVAYLDQDDEYYPDYLARAWEVRDQGDVIVFRYDQVDELVGSRTLGRITEYDPATRYKAMFAETIAVPLGVVHRRELLDTVGGFNESLGKHRGQDEDGDLWRRFARAGVKFTFVPHKSGLYHVRSDSFARTRPPAPLPASGLPSPVMAVDLRAGTERYTIHIPQAEAGLVAQVFDRHEYGGVPLKRLNRPPVVLDVGANVGTFALYVKLVLDRQAVIHSFEPYPPVVELLRRNLSPFPDVTIHPVGLGRRDGMAELLLDPRWGTTGNSTRPDLVPNPTGRVPVQIRDAGAVWDELGLAEVDVLKVDAEGAEVNILEALGPRLRRVRVVLAEFHTAADRRRIDALLPDHELFGTTLHSVRVGVVKYIRRDLLGGGALGSDPLDAVREGGAPEAEAGGPPKSCGSGPFG